MRKAPGDLRPDFTGQAASSQHWPPSRGAQAGDKVKTRHHVAVMHTQAAKCSSPNETSGGCKHGYSMHAASACSSSTTLCPQPPPDYAQCEQRIPQHSTLLVPNCTLHVEALRDTPKPWVFRSFCLVPYCPRVLRMRCSAAAPSCWAVPPGYPYTSACGSAPLGVLVAPFAWGGV